MSANKDDQVIPFAPAAERVHSDEEVAEHLQSYKIKRRRNWILCCGFCSATILILGVLILVLALTVFRVKDPQITMNSVSIDRFDMGAPQGTPPTLIAFNMTLTADISVKNPNAATFKFQNSTTLISYQEETIGQAHIPAGKAKAKGTLRMNVTVDVLVDRLLLGDMNRLSQDFFKARAVDIQSYTKISGRVNLLNLFKRHADVVMNCTMKVSLKTQAIEDQKCKRRVKM